MDKNLLKKRIRRNRRNAMIHRYVRVGAVVLAFLGIIFGIWKVIEWNQYNSDSARKKRNEEVANSPISADIKDYETKNEITDISGAAVWIQMSDDMHAAAAKAADSDTKEVTKLKSALDTLSNARWVDGPGGRFYTIDGVHCYAGGFETIEGQSYHFSRTGYVDTGWTAIGGKGYYFNEDGIEDPSKYDSKLIALTFDDGPGPHTGELLDLMEQTGAKGTFFMVGTQVEKYGADAIPRMVSLGCQLGNHSYSHANMKELGVEGTKEQFQKTDALIAQYSGGAPASVVRFPYGAYTKELATASGHPSILWNTDTMDWNMNTADEIVDNVLNKQLIEPGCLILMHDIQQISVEACKRIIPELINRGYELVTVEDLAASKGYELTTGVTYFGFTDHEVQVGKVNDQ